MMIELECTRCSARWWIVYGDRTHHALVCWSPGCRGELKIVDAARTEVGERAARTHVRRRGDE